MGVVAIPIFGAVAAAGAASVVGAAVGGGILGAVVGSIAGGVVSTGFSLITARKPKAPSFSSSLQANNTTQAERLSGGLQVTRRSGVEHSKIVYGRARIGGVIAWEGTQNDGSQQNKFYHAIISFTGHEIDAIEDIYLDEVKLNISGNSATGSVWESATKNPLTQAVGGYTGDFLKATTSDNEAQIITSNVTSGGQSGSSLAVSIQIASRRLRQETTIVNNRRVITDLSDTYTLPTGTVLKVGEEFYRLASNVNLTVTGSATLLVSLPLDRSLAISPAAGQLFGLYKPVSIVQSPAASSQNSLVLVRKFLGTEVQEAVPELLSAFPSEWSSAHQLKGRAYLYIRMTYDETAFPNGLPNVTAVLKGKKIYDPRTNTVAWSDNPALIAADYIVSDVGFNAPNKVDWDNVALAANACDELVTLANGNTEKRYTCNVALSRGDDLFRNLEVIASSFSGVFTDFQGRIIMQAGVWETPSYTVDESWLAGGLTAVMKTPRSELFNQLQGLYIEPSQDWRSMGYPNVGSSLFALADGGVITQEINYAATTSQTMAQRLARIVLLKNREGLTCEMLCNTKAMQLAPLDRIYVNNTNMGWVNKVFLISGISENPDGTFSLKLEEDGQEIYDWNTSLEQTLDILPNSAFPDPFFVPQPSVPSVVEELYVGSNSLVAVRVQLSWLQTSPFVSEYILEWRQVGGAEWNSVLVNTTQAVIGDLAQGVLQIRLTAVNEIKQRSAPVYREYDVVGQSAPPADITGFSINEIGGNAHLSWDLSVDLDVRVGGRIELRYQDTTSGATWSQAVKIAPALAGNSTSAVVPLLAGTYLIKAVDAGGRESVNATTIITTVANILPLNAVATSDQHPTFAGAKIAMEVISSELQMQAAELWDDATGLWDDRTGLFDGSGDSFAVQGSYTFDAPIDLGDVYTARVFIKSKYILENGSLTFDSREGLWDSAQGLFDGEDITGITIDYFIRTTDDPTSSPVVWSPWRKFVVGDYTARGFDFKLEVTSEQNNLNIKIDYLSVEIDVPDRIEQDEDYALSAAGETITFSKPFFITPSVGVSVQDGATGDRVEISSKSASSFFVRCYNSSSVGVARTIDWIARGY